ncbi:MAG: glycosyltransferase family 2 protein [Bacteroidetes bacterium]|nr:glycosyltransferase family 2 protein [Bacteroidota bacterium]
MKVSIVIRCLNEEKHIGRLLAGIMEQNHNDVEIIVVDSGSTDATLSIASQFPTRIIHIKPEEFSFGFALNKGCEAATGDILLFASAHVYPVFKDWLEKIADPFKDPEVALVYGKQQGDERTRFSEHQIFAKWFPDVSVADQKHPFCNNANCAIRKNLWESHPYDETLTGLEDLAWAKQIQEEGWKIAYQAEAAIVHVHEEKWKSVFNRYRREAIALRLIMKHETFNFLTFLNLLIKNWWNDWKQAAHNKVLRKEFGSIFLFRLMQFWGTYRGYKQSYLLDNAVRERFYYPKGYVQNQQQSNDSDRRIDYSQLDH